MALLFSAVTMKSGEAETRFLVGGIPRIKNDLTGWIAYENFMREARGEIETQVDSYAYGGEVLVKATVEEVAYLTKRLESRADFLERSCDLLGRSQFTIKNEKGEKAMNEWEKERQQAKRYKEQYPPGTRLQLINMEDPYAPVESGTRGTVKLVDDIGQIHMHWDNGRTLALVPGQDSFRTLTEEELKQEERLKNGKVVDFGDDCQIVIPKEPIDCSKLGYFDELESECWDLVKGYLAKFGIELLPNEDGEEPMSDYVAKGVQDKIVEMLQESGVEFKFEQDETEEPVEEGGMNMA
jgi:hypothetical protein